MSLDLDQLARDVDQVLTTTQDWWPADFGHYGPLVLRMAWHCAGTYRVGDGRGGPSAGMQRFAPLNSWPDNRNLDKARRLLWPVKKKYGRKISWSDLMVFAGNRALESMGFTTFGFAGGRGDVWEADDTYWGPEDTWCADERHSGVRDLDEPLAATEMGLIYVNPQGPATLPDPVAAARDIRRTFRRMGMNDEETVALIAGGHTFGKTHGVAHPDTWLGPEPEGAPLEAQGLGWANGFGSGNAADTIGSGLEGIWTPTPTTWDNSFLETLFAYTWNVALSPAGLWQWVPSDGAGAGIVPDAHDPSKTHAPTMLTTDLALQEDPIYEAIARRFLNESGPAGGRVRAGLVQAHAHRYGPDPALPWATGPDRTPDLAGPCATSRSRAHRCRRHRGAQEPTPRLGPVGIATRLHRVGLGFDVPKQRQARWGEWGAHPSRTAAELGRQRARDAGARAGTLEEIGKQFNDSQPGDKRISLADLIVLGGCAAIEQAAARAGHDIEVPFRPGRTDATQEWTDVEWFAALEPTADAFRNYVCNGKRLPTELQLVDRASQLTLSAAEMTVLLGGLRVLGANHGQSPLGVFTSTPGSLTTDFFINLLDTGTEWVPRTRNPGRPTTFEGRDRCTGEVKWVGSRVDLAFRASSELRALSEVYASQDAEEKFVRDFVSAWDKVMNLDLFDQS